MKWNYYSKGRGAKELKIGVPEGFSGLHGDYARVNRGPYSGFCRVDVGKPPTGNFAKLLGSHDLALMNFYSHGAALVVKTSNVNIFT